MIFWKKKKISNTKLIEKYYDNIPSHLEYPNNMIYEHLFETALEHPSFIAYEYYGKKITYQAFIRQIKEAAKSFKKLGIKENEIITVCEPNTPEGIISFYAINMIGCIANMVHPLSSENEILNYLNITNSTRIVTIDITLSKILNIVSQTKVQNIIVTTASHTMQYSTKFLYWLFEGRKVKIPKNDLIIPWSKFITNGYYYQDEYIAKKDKIDPAVILYSGGTTGKPKGILLSNLNFNALSVQSRMMCQPNKAKDIILCIMPIFHGFGLGVCLHTTLCIGMKCILIPAFKFRDFKKLIKKYQPNFIVGVPTLFESLINSAIFKKDDFKNVTNIISGGDTMTPELKKKVDDFFFRHGSKAKVRVGYGLTECTAACSLTTENELRENCIGIPFPDMEYKIVNIGTHDEVERNTDGEICINGPTVMLEYINDPSETMQILREHDDGKIWLHTGDVGWMDEEGMIFFRQRIKRIIISSGYNIYPSYIENVLNQHEAVLCSTVIGIDHPYKVQVAKAFIVLKDGYKKSDDLMRSIKKHCEKNIAKYSLPYEYEFRNSLPKTKIGKVAFTELMEEEQKKKK